MDYSEISSENDEMSLFRRFLNWRRNRIKNKRFEVLKLETADYILAIKRIRDPGERVRAHGEFRKWLIERVKELELK